MGAWGHGYFDDDAALDFMAEIEASDYPKEIIKEALEMAIETDYLEADEGNAVIISAIYIDKQINGTKFSDEDSDEPLDVDTFPERHPYIDFSDLQNDAVLALKRLLDNNSELNELWKENEEDYPAWQQGIVGLIKRLQE
ncbi:MAG: DUF4259 domain-containing protein [Chitinophagales bacterium]|nr:DUF4259 domain-containing protein [Chitinophagales bacterium]